MIREEDNVKNVRVLDCTLRDGGRIINCAFPDQEIIDISDKLASAKVDIIEIGFLRDSRDVIYMGNSTFFTNVRQIEALLSKRNSNCMYVAFVDFGMFDIDSLEQYDGNSIDGIRLGFTKKNYAFQKEEVIRWAQIIKERGYKLFIQGVNSLSYSDYEMLEVVELINSIHPYSFGIVDTYGAMYMDDVDRLFSLIDHNMEKDICINFHSHNNYQLSFAFAQEIIKLSETSKRQVIIDVTLNGMGKVAGNLNAELLVDFLIRKKNYEYNLDLIFDLIDEYIYKYAAKYSWGYSVPGLMAGVFKSHPNNVIYLTEKFRLNTKDIGKLLAMIEPEKRQTYDYDNIERIYRDYSGKAIDDSKTIDELRRLFNKKNVLVLVPGNSLNVYHDQIAKFIANNNVIVISVNFVSEFGNSYAFYGNQKRYSFNQSKREGKQVVITSNIDSDNNTDYIVNYHGLINQEYTKFDDSTMMLLYLLAKLNIGKMFIAGYDGFCASEKDNFVDESFQNERHNMKKFDEINCEIAKMFKNFAEKMFCMFNIVLLTPSYYKKYLGDVCIEMREGDF